MTEFFTKEHFQLLKDYAGKKGSADDEEYQKLIVAEEITKTWAEEVKQAVFGNRDIKIVRKPTNQGQNYKGYTWARLYPSNELDESLAFTVGIEAEHGFVVKIDTVALNENSTLRKEYLKIRGDFFNSPLVKILAEQEGLGWNLEKLIRWAAEKIKEMEDVYHEVYEKLGLIKTNKEVDASSDESLDKHNLSSRVRSELNQILFGPPGTGKTYHTVNKAISIIENRDISDEESRDDLKQKFDEYRKNGQIEFVTFHQSYGYEEFVEGIKATTNEGQLNYSVESGVFKEISEEAKSNYENFIKKKDENGKQVLDIEKLLNDFANYVKEQGNFLLREETYLNNINIDSNGNFKSFKTSGRVAGQSLTKSIIVRDFECYLSGRIKSHEGIKPSRKSNSTRHGNSIYYFDLYEKIKAFLNKNKHVYMQQAQAITLNNYVLIIDEINRGNISKIFGELITLIEPSKRIGAKEELRISLPYSNSEPDPEPFGVPKNLYIIGTMNTADRSIAPIDTALRRRFEFEEMLPRPELLSDDVEGVNLQELLTAINDRIEYLYDRDHTIGHSYFMDIESLEDLQLTFKNKIIPLLAEYFYEDWENIDLVLNENGFIKEKPNKNNHLKKLVNQIQGKKVFEITPEVNWTIDSFKKIYSDELSEQGEDE